MEQIELLAIDLGAKRTGLARANTQVKIPEPLPHLTATGLALPAAITAIAKRQKTGRIIIGLPKNLHNPNDSDQAARSRELANQLAKQTNTEIVFADETLSTAEAEKWHRRYPAASEDSLAACVILERYLNEGDIK